MVDATPYMQTYPSAGAGAVPACGHEAPLTRNSVLY